MLENISLMNALKTAADDELKVNQQSALKQKGNATS